MTIENPPRLWAFAVRGAIHAAPEEAPLLASVHQGWGAAKPQAYVREDVAETETTALRRERDAAVETTLTAMLEELRKRGWECPGGLDGDDHAVCASRVRQALTAK